MYQIDIYFLSGLFRSIACPTKAIAKYFATRPNVTAWRLRDSSGWIESQGAWPRNAFQPDGCAIVWEVPE